MLNVFFITRFFKIFIDKIKDNQLIEVLQLLGDDWNDILINKEIRFGSFFPKIKKEIAAAISEKLKKINFEFKVDIPRKQLALLFLEVSPILLNKTGRICFIQKSTSLLYNQDKKSNRNHANNYWWFL